MYGIHGVVGRKSVRSDIFILARNNIAPHGQGALGRGTSELNIAANSAHKAYIHRGTHILVSDSPDGRFIPVSEKPATPEDRECLDGTLYVSRKGKPYIVFCHEWLQIADGTVCAAKLAPDLSGIIEEPRVLWHGSDFTGKKPGQDNYVTDGPFMIRGENDELYCIWSTFADQGYAEVVSVSDNGEIDGNWSVLKEPLFEKDGGHGMVFRTFTGEDIFVMHKPNTSTLERPVLSRLYKNDRKLHIVE